MDEFNPMLNDPQRNRLAAKVYELAGIYEPFLFEPLFEAETTLAVTAKSFSEPPHLERKPIRRGETWGGPFQTGWFHLEFEVTESLADRNLFVFSDSGAVEHLIFVNGEPDGALDYVRKGERPFFRLHKYWRLTDCAKAGERFVLDLEGYASQAFPGNNPLDTPVTFATETLEPERTFEGIFIGSVNADVRKFLNDLRFLCSLRESRPDKYTADEIDEIFDRVFCMVSRVPGELPREEALGQIRACNEFLETALRSDPHKRRLPGVSLIGHSHMDTVWLWDTEETRRKLARTCLHALRMMDLYPDYTFIQSSSLHLEWMKESYPKIFERVKARVAEGRYECNGGSYVECDANLTGGEAMVRQFVRGQKFNLENFGKLADVYWLPDTFGYSAAIPQILKGCGIDSFLTTKINANDTNRFPYDTFFWRGIDGTEVLAQYNVIHCYADPRTIRDRMDFINTKCGVSRTLISYGFGDGGGGPSEDMVEIAERTIDSAWTPFCEHTTVSEHMKRVREDSVRIPVYDGELYFELHRGTLTTMGEIKRNNRRLEIELRGLELLAATLGVDVWQELDAVWKLLLVNQFHDILPGTSIERAHESAFARFREAFSLCGALREKLLPGKQGQLPGSACAAFNPLNWERSGELEVEATPGDEGAFEAVDGSLRRTLGGVRIPALSFAELPPYRKAESQFRFDFEYGMLETPVYRAVIEEGKIVSLVDRAAQRELVSAGGALNAFFCGEDVPLNSDNWDVDADQSRKMKPAGAFLGAEVVPDATFRLRCRHRIGRNSELVQDIVFHADDRRIDFDTRLNWREKHTLLKACFTLDVKCASYRSEIQFGHLERSAKRNTTAEQAMFEVCSHKWTDMSEPSYGVSLFTDSKYGVSVADGFLTLSLAKGGTHPDTRGDEGTHFFRYALLPHEGGFSAERVVRPAYAFNCPPLQCEQAPEVFPVVEIENVNVVLEAAKRAEDGRGTILRLYECEGTRTNLKIKFDAAKKITVVDMLEEALEEPIESDALTRVMPPFRILSLRIENIK